MAKSLRSKWRNKMRTEKRVKYSQRELERLKATVANDIYNKKPADTETSEISEIVTVVDPKQVVQNASQSQEDADVMEVEALKSKYNRRTMKDENGHYPVWLSKKKIKEISLKNKKKKKAKMTGKKKIGGKRRNR